MRIIDTTDPITPVQNGIFYTNGLANDINVSGTTAYLSDDPKGLKMVDIQNPSAPVFVSAIQVSENSAFSDSNFSNPVVQGSG